MIDIPENINPYAAPRSADSGHSRLVEPTVRLGTREVLRWSGQVKLLANLALATSLAEILELNLLTAVIGVPLSGLGIATRIAGGRLNGFSPRGWHYAIFCSVLIIPAAAMSLYLQAVLAVLSGAHFIATVGSIAALAATLVSITTAGSLRRVGPRAYEAVVAANRRQRVARPASPPDFDELNFDGL